MDTGLDSPPKTRATLKRKLSPTNAIYELIQCPVCSSSMYPPISQCPHGHTLCSKCKDKVNNRCPSCRHTLGNIRCLALEKVAESLEFSCMYQPSGCQHIIGYHEKINHEQQCRFRPYNCPYAVSECSVDGDIVSLIAHLTNDHKADMILGSTFNRQYVNPNHIKVATWTLKVYSCFDKYFCLHFEAFLERNAPVYMAFLRFMGEADEASSFRYTLEVGGRGRRLVWQGVPRSIRDGHRRVRDSMDGLRIPRHLALLFSAGDHKHLNLSMKGRIWKEN